MEGSAKDATLIARHQAIKARLRMLRLTYPVVILVILIGYIWSIVNQVKAIDAEKIASRLEEGAHKLLPQIQDALADVAKELEPVLTKELERQSAKLGPKLEKVLEKETEELKVRLEKSFKEELTKALAEIENRQRGVLVEHIPELKDDKKGQDRVLETVRVGLLKWSMRQLTHTFHEHVIAMEQIRKTLQKSYTSKVGKGGVRPDDAVVIWLELMNETVGGDENILGTPKEDKKKKKKKKSRKKKAN